ncbi:hypothetical protein WCP94_000618 (plasmid) [Bilophila wadsworthia]
MKKRGLKSIFLKNSFFQQKDTDDILPYFGLDGMVSAMLCQCGQNGALFGI